MKRFLLSMLLMLLSAASFAAQKDTLRVLAIGNSFSQDAIEQNLYSLAAADGKVLIIGNMYIGGCSLERHYQNSRNNAPDYEYRKIEGGVRNNRRHMTLEKALADEKWDYVSFQQASHFSGKAETYEPFLTDLISYVAARVPADTKFLFHQTWAYESTSDHYAFPDYDRDQQKMYKLIIDCSKKACKDHKLTVVPAGTAVQNLRGTFLGDHITRDGYHMDLNYGRYLVACTWYEVLFGKSPVGNAFVRQGLDEKTAQATQKAAHAAVKNPWKVSKIK